MNKHLRYLLVGSAGLLVVTWVAVVVIGVLILSYRLLGDISFIVIAFLLIAYVGGRISAGHDR